MKRLRGIVLVILVLAALAVGGDFVAKLVTERSVASNLEQDGAVTGVDVSIHGFPFVTQVLDKHLDDVSGSAASATIGGLTVDDLSVQASGVTTSEPYTVEDGTATGTVPLATIKKVIADKTGFDVDLAVKGATLTLSVNALGTTITADVEPAVASPQKIQLNLSRITLGGAALDINDLPGFLANQVKDLSIPLDMPAGIELTSTTVVNAGVQVTVHGTDVNLESLVTS